MPYPKPNFIVVNETNPKSPFCIGLIFKLKEDCKKTLRTMKEAEPKDTWQIRHRDEVSEYNRQGLLKNLIYKPEPWQRFIDSLN